MADSYHRLYVHLVWATKERQPTLLPELEEPVYACLRTTAERLRARVLAIGGTDDHVHVLVRFPTTTSIQELVAQMKGASSHLIRHRLERPEFRWQNGYGAFTLQRTGVAGVTVYIENQKEHHRTGELLPTLECDAEPGQSGAPLRHPATNAPH